MGKNPWKWEQNNLGTAFRATSPFDLGEGGSILVARFSNPQTVLGLPSLRSRAGEGGKMMYERILKVMGHYCGECLFVEDLSEKTEAPKVIRADAQMEYQIVGEDSYYTVNSAFFDRGNVVAVCGSLEGIGKVNLEKLSDGTEGKRLVPVFRQGMEAHAKRVTEHRPEMLKEYSFEKIRKLLGQLDMGYREAFKVML